MFIGAISALSMAIVALWRLIVLHHKQCDEDREKLWEYVMKQNKETCEFAQTCQDAVKLPTPRRL